MQSKIIPGIYSTLIILVLLFSIMNFAHAANQTVNSTANQSVTNQSNLPPSGSVGAPDTVIPQRVKNSTSNNNTSNAVAASATVQNTTVPKNQTSLNGSPSKGQALPAFLPILVGIVAAIIISYLVYNGASKPRKEAAEE